MSYFAYVPIQPSQVFKSEFKRPPKENEWRNHEGAGAIVPDIHNKLIEKGFRLMLLLKKGLAHKAYCRRREYF